MIAESESAVKVVYASVVIPVCVNRKFNFAIGMRQTAPQHVAEVLTCDAAPPHVAPRAERLIARGDADERHIGRGGIFRRWSGEHLNLLDARCL